MSICTKLGVRDRTSALLPGRRQRASRLRLATAIAAAGIGGMGSRLVHAATDNWQNANGGAFGDATNWSAGVPQAGDDAVFNISSNSNPYGVTFDASAYSSASLSIISNQVNFTFQRTDNPSNYSAGMTNIVSANNTTLSALTLYGFGTLYSTSSTIGGAGSQGAVELAGSGTTWSTGSLSVGDHGVGVLQLFGVTNSIQSKDVTVGAMGGAGGVLFEGGTFNANSLTIGMVGGNNDSYFAAESAARYDGPDSVSASGIVSISGPITINSGTLDMNGGELIANSLTGAPGKLNFTAGTIVINSEYSLGGPFAANLTLGAGMALQTQDLTVATSHPLTVAGGALAATTITSANDIAYTSGRVYVTGGDIMIDPGPTGYFTSPDLTLNGAHGPSATADLLSASGNLTVGNTGDASLAVAGGAATATNVNIAAFAGTSSVTTSEGGTVTAAGQVVIGGHATGTDTSVAGGTGSLVVTGGSVTAALLTVHGGSSASVSGGTVTFGGVVVGPVSGPASTVTLSGGSFYTNGLTIGNDDDAADTATVSVSGSSGGLLGGSTSATVAGPVTVNASGALNVLGGSFTTQGDLTVGNTSGGAFSATGGVSNINGNLNLAANADLRNRTASVTVGPADGSGFVNVTVNGQIVVGGSATDATTSVPGGTGSLVVIPGGFLQAGSLTVYSGSTVNLNTGTSGFGAGVLSVTTLTADPGTVILNGGSLFASTFTNGNSVAFNGGGVSSDNLVVDPGAAGTFTTGNVTLNSSQSYAGVADNLHANADLTVGVTGDASLNVSGGSASATNLNIAATSGTASLTAGNGNYGGGTVTVAGQIVVGGHETGTTSSEPGGTGTVTVTPGGSVTGSSLTVYAGSTVNVDGGFLQVATFNGPSGSLRFTGGTLEITNQNVTIGTGGTLPGPVAVGGTFVFGSTTLTDQGLTLNPGALTTGTLSRTGTGQVTFNGGLLNVTGGDVHIGPASDPANTVASGATVGNGSTFQVSGTTVVGNGGSLTVNGGSLVTGHLATVGTGTFTFNSGTLTDPSDDLVVDDASTPAPTHYLGAHPSISGYVTFRSFTIGGTGTGSLAFHNGTLVSNNAFIIGDAPGGQGTLTVGVALGDGGGVNAPSLIVGNAGQGTFNLVQGYVPTGGISIAAKPGSAGTVTLGNYSELLAATVVVGGTYTTGTGGVVTTTRGGIGTLNVGAHGELGATYLDNYGTINVTDSGLVGVGSTYVNEAGSHLNVGPNATFDPPIIINKGALAGTGTIAGTSITSSGTVSPGGTQGADIGTLTFIGSLNLSSGSQLDVQVGTDPAGTTAGVKADRLAVNGSVTLGGDLVLSLSNNAQTQIGSSTFTILSSNAALTGALDNVANDARLETADGGGSFQVNYGAGSPYGADDVVLSDFVASTPEPTSLALLGLAAVPGLLRRRRTAPPGR